MPTGRTCNDTRSRDRDREQEQEQEQEQDLGPADVGVRAPRSTTSRISWAWFSWGALWEVVRPVLMPELAIPEREMISETGTGQVGSGVGG